MNATARLVVTRGPDEGREFDVSSDLAHIGRDGSNQIVLTDPGLARHQASIVCRGGRYALFTPLDGAVEVDGAQVPADRWVWLPAAADIQFGLETVLHFQTSMAANGQITSEAESIVPSDRSSIESSLGVTPQNKDGSSSTAKRRRRRSEPKRSAARLTLDAAGEPRVQLGADGRLPELRLSEAGAIATETSGKSGVQPWLVIAAVIASTAMSALLLLWTPDHSGSPGAVQAQARFQLRNFYGKEGSELEPYQQLLRRAAVEHSQGRVREERRLYLKVLDLLNSADVLDPGNFHGLTGRQTGRGRNGDSELRGLLESLVSSP
jgi:hypothetical protein